jgi:hypothetical protein
MALSQSLYIEREECVNKKASYFRGRTEGPPFRGPAGFPADFAAPPRENRRGRGPGFSRERRPAGSLRVS